MSEARIRSLAQNSSKIFSGSLPERIKQRENPQSQSKIFKPLNIIPKPLTYARAQYEKTTICLGKDKNEEKIDSPGRNHSNFSPAGKKTGQAASTKYLIGNERSSFYKKSINEKIPVNENFEPKYANQSAFERKQKEFNNGWSPERETKVIEKSASGLTAKDRKLQDRVSIFDQKVYEIKERRIDQVDRKENINPEYNPKDRRAENFSSEVFEKRNVKEYKKPLEVVENEETRKKNHMFSDLFGRASSPTREKVKDRLIPTDHYFAAYGRQNLDYSANFQTNKNLSSQINFGEPSQKTDRQRPKTPNVSSSLPQSAPAPTPASNPTQSQSAAELYSLDLSSIPASTTSSSIKELCGGVHVVSLVLQIDNFTGLCQGTGQLKIRTNDLSDLSRIEKVFKSRGMQVRTSQLSLGRKSNYAEISNVSWHHPYDYKKTSTPLGARESKMRNLESTFFEGQVKWTERATESLKHELSAQLLWSNTKNASKGQY